MIALASRLMPIVRYDAGDLARSLIGECSWGAGSPAFAGIVGRQMASIFAEGGKAVSPYRLLSIAANLHVPEYQLVQSERGKLRVVLAEGARVAPKTAEDVDRRLVEACAARLDVSIDTSGAFALTENGKRNPVVSLVDR